MKEDGIASNSKRGRLSCRPRLIATNDGKAMNPSDIQTLITTGLPGAKAIVESDDNTHYSAVIVAEQFNGKRTLQRHQLIYATLGSKMGNEIHALSIQAHTPQEWQALSK
jgi:acid stress-induced BolA-like protein IbaG/YrbA